MEVQEDKPRFSRRAVIAAIEVLAWRLSHAQYAMLLLRASAGYRHLIGNSGESLPKRAVNLVLFYDEQPDTRCDDGERLGDHLVSEAVKALPPASPWGIPDDNPADARQDALLRALATDGYSTANGLLRPSMPVDIGLPSVLDELTDLLGKHALTTSQSHLAQALDAHAMGNWASANAQLRTYFDSLLDDIAVALDPSAAQLGTGQPRRTKLSQMGLLSRELNEWDDKGNGYINGLVRRLHPHGAHPGLSDQDDSTFRLHTVLLTSRLLLRRFDGWPAHATGR